MSAQSCPLLWSIAVSVILQFNTKLFLLLLNGTLIFFFLNLIVSSSVNVVCDFVPVWCLLCVSEVLFQIYSSSKRIY